MQSDRSSCPVCEWWTILNEFWPIFWFKRSDTLLSQIQPTAGHQLWISTFYIHCDLRDVICALTYKMLKKLFSCIIIVLDLIQQLHLITTLKDCLKIGNFQIQKWPRTQCTCGFKRKQKYSLQMESGNSWTSVTYVWRM